MSGHRLGGTHGHFVCVLSQSLFYRECLGLVVEEGSGTVCIDVQRVLVRIVSRLLEGHPYSQCSGLAVGTRRGGVVGVAGSGVSGNFCKYFRVARQCVPVFLKYQYGGAFRQHEALAPGVERDGRPGRVIGGRQRLGTGEAADDEWVNGRLGAAADHSVGRAGGNGAIGFSQGVCACGTGSYSVDAGALGVEPDGDIARSDVRDHRRNEQRRYPEGSFLEQDLGLVHEGGESSDAASDIYS